MLAAVRSCLTEGQKAHGSNNLEPLAAGEGDVHLVMVVGTPNVGKTSLINALKRHCNSQGLLNNPRSGKLEVGPLPGVTKRVSGIKVCCGT